MKVIYEYKTLDRKDESKTGIFSGRVRLQNIIKSKRIPPSQIMKQNIAELQNEELPTPLKLVEKPINICNGTNIPPNIRGFSGPMNNNQIQRILSSIGYSPSEMYLGMDIDPSKENNYYAYYLCDYRKVLNTVTNQRFFRLPCNSSRFEPGISELRYPTCYDPTHCIGKPKTR